MTKAEQKVFEYAQSVEWDYVKVRHYISSMPLEDRNELKGVDWRIKAKYFIEKHKPKEGGEYNFLTITLPIEDYNRLRKLEIKKEIKKLKKELKGL